ncbi:MAG TPA: ArsI/CadI family heavy metal resistance metalloenzyme [Burkholderiales bacterium]|nr:ArsI/CadI family heavy metal resistance metalloenzyme [Burkholderiales bacterium]
MKRLHVHVAVDDLEANINFYSTVFGSPPSVAKPDYAKWMLEDPRINFAISQRGARPGLDHLGIQVDSDEELSVLRERMAGAEIAAFEQRNAECCYARFDKYWITDPQGIAWETFHSLSEAPLFGVDSQKSACCAPLPQATATSPAKACC